MSGKKTSPGPPLKYMPRYLDEKLGYLVEECGEVMAAVGKTLRWGLDSYNPELPASEQETNRAWVLRELDDLEVAIRIVREELAMACAVNDGVAAKKELSALRAEVERLRFCDCPCDCANCFRVERAKVESLRATIARVEAFADDLDRIEWHGDIATKLRTALKGDS